MMKINQNLRQLAQLFGRVWMDIVMGLIAIAQAVLIIAVYNIVTSNHSRHQDFQSSIKVLYESDLFDQVDSLNKETTLAESEAVLRKATTDIAGLESMIMKSNDYFTLILSLITLCATLAVVIPYLVGKSISKNYIDEKINAANEQVNAVQYQATLLKHQIDDSNTELNVMRKDIEAVKSNAEQKYNESLKELEKYHGESIDSLSMAEAHISRMIAYLLVHKDGKIEHAPLEKIWAIGWASKSLLRYINNYGKGGGQHYDIDKFIDYSLQVIKVSVESIQALNVNSVDNCDMKGKVLRAFIDLYDAVRMAEHKNIIIFERSYNDIIQPSLLGLLNTAIKLNGAQAVLDGVKNKSKLYNGKDESNVLNDVKKWVQENLKITL